jgi:hypothetical protein
MTSILATRPQPLTAQRRALLAARAAVDELRIARTARPKPRRRMRVLVRIDDAGNRQTFPNAYDAAREHEVWPNAIVTAAHRRGRCRGYRWRWADDPGGPEAPPREKRCRFEGRAYPSIRAAVEASGLTRRRVEVRAERLTA